MVSNSAEFEGEINIPGAERVFFSPENEFALVCVPNAEKIVIINRNDGSITKTIQVGGQVNNGVFSSNGDKAFISIPSPGSRRILEFDTSDWTPVRQINLDGSDMAIVKNPPSVYARSVRSLSELDLGQSPGVIRSLDFDRDLYRLIVRSQGDYIVVDDFQSVFSICPCEWTKTRIVSGVNLAVLAVEHQGNHIYVANFSQNIVQVYDVASQQVIASLPFKANAAVLSLDDLFAFLLQSDGASMKVVDARNDFKVVGDVSIGGSPVSGAVTPDGSRIYICNRNGVKVFDPTQWMK